LKLETRNSKQIQTIKKQKISNQLSSDFGFWISDLSVSFVSDFELRISDFDSVLAQEEQTVSKFEEASL